MRLLSCSRCSVSLFFPRKTLLFLSFFWFVISSTLLFMIIFSLVCNVKVWYTHIKGLIDTVLLGFKDFVILLYLVSSVLWRFTCSVLFLFYLSFADFLLLWVFMVGFVSWFFVFCMLLSIWILGKKRKAKKWKQVNGKEMTKIEICACNVISWTMKGISGFKKAIVIIRRSFLIWFVNVCEVIFHFFDWFCFLDSTSRW